ncbi:hypothetical protein CWO90_09835 [Bradyrhizobium sp. Leo121]|nr:hypothetical protein CWO90_09835 [Bradyrhizobium sp. Leo121]
MKSLRLNARYNSASLQALAVCVLSVVLMSWPALAGDDVLIGALRWDNWTSKSPEVKVLAQPEWKDRVPFFARYDEQGHLTISGDMDNVLTAEVAYAYSAGIDYFVFGFYPETGSWGRNVTDSLALNRALATYLRLKDRKGIRFAVSLNQSFPEQDVADISESIAAFVADKGYVRTANGSAPLFVFTQNPKGWGAVYGSDEAARRVVQQIKKRVYEKSGVNLLFILEYPDPAVAAEQARKTGMDMASAYSTFSPPRPGEHVFSDCVANNSNYWGRASNAGFPFVPNVTLGWDPRPRDSVRVREGKEPQVKSWCDPPRDNNLKQLLQSAFHAVASQPGPLPFRSVLVYAWNEFTEGGWLAPTWNGGTAKLDEFRKATGRNRTIDRVTITWPDAAKSDRCPVRTGERDRKEVLQQCSRNVEVSEMPRWPCPPGMRSSEDRVRAPTGLEALYWSGLWIERTCIGG